MRRLNTHKEFISESMKSHLFKIGNVRVRIQSNDETDEEMRQNAKKIIKLVKKIYPNLKDIDING